ncbi:MAG: hypothetical protein EB036_07610, partial [Betaproteobacteria bacterium]|nr:hypothetical protein [Betaproteobacteria bacterium]
REKPARTLQVRYLQADAPWFGEKLKRWFRSMLQLSGLRGLLEPSAAMVHQDPLQDLLVDLYREGRWAAQWLRSEERWSAQAHCFCSVEP